MLLLLGGFLLLMLVGLPVALAMAVSSLVYILVSGITPDVTLAQRMIAGVESFPLLAVPFFILAGNLMNIAGVTGRIYKFAVALVGWMRGGLGHVNIIGSVIFSGMSGTAIADAAGLGTIEIKAMKDHGYSTEFAVARLSGVEAGFLTNWRERVKILNEARAARVAAIRRVRPDLVPARADSCIRLPILCASREERDRVFEAARRARLGFSLMYPSAIRAIPALAGAMAEARCPTADSIAERLVTVPVHPLVSASDSENIEKVLKGVRPPVQ
jgi:hypothetical protein